MNAFFKKAGLGIALAATALTAAAAPADAQRWGGYRGGWHGGYHRGGIGPGGAAVLGGILGLGVGAAIASSNRPYYGNRGYYYDAPPPPPPRAYYDGGYGYDGYYAPRCWDQWRWDPYYGHNVRVRVCN